MKTAGGDQLDWSDDQSQPSKAALQDDELERVQRGAEGPKLADNVAEPGHGVVRTGHWRARAPVGLLRCTLQKPRHKKSLLR